MSSRLPVRHALSAAAAAACLAQTEVGALLLDDDGRIVAINGYLSGLLRQRSARLCGEPLADIGKVFPGPQSLQRRLAAARAGQPYRDHLSLLGQDGVRLHFSFRWCGRVPGGAPGADLIECRFLGLRTVRPPNPGGSALRQRQRVLDRPAFEQAVRSALAQTRETGRPCSLLSIRVDRLPADDAAAAARAFRQFAEGCVAQLREGDRVGLLDRRHFVVLLPGVLAKNAVQVAERLRAAIAVPAAVDGAQAQWPRLTVSIGIVTTRTGLSSYPALRSRAEAKCDDARQRGGNRING